MSFLGLDVIRALVLCVKLFHEFKSRVLSPGLLDDLMIHSLTVARFAHKIGQGEGRKPEELENLFTSACFHDVGKLIFYSHLPEKYQKTIDFIAANGCDENEAEKNILGVTHAEVGAYLMCLWGLKDEIVDSILFHHSPAQSICESSGLPLLYAADCLYYEFFTDKKPVPECRANIDMDYLEAKGLAGKLSDWRAMLNRK